MNRIRTFSICALMVASLSHAQAIGVTAEDNTSAIHDKMADFAARTVVHAALSPKEGVTKPKLVATPFFRWTDPERKTDVGNIFLWTVNGRPHATLGIWPEGDKHGYEMQSLANKPFLVEFSNGEDWDKDRPDQPRLLSNPLFRYGKEKPDNVIDGAVFAFAHGTDPEMLVILEARKSRKSEDLVWNYALGSATLFFLDAYLDGNHVWTDRQKLADQTYFMRY